MLESFNELKGQELCKKILNRYILKTPPSLLIFHGPRGVGKFSTAELFIKTFLCANKNACGTCRSCNLYSKLSHPDYIRFPEGKIKIGDPKNPEFFTIRWLQNSRLNFSPINSEYRFVLFPEGHNFQHEAGTALLKTLEESQNHTKFIILVNKLRDLKSTIQSRGQLIPFKFLSNENIKNITLNKDEETINILGGSLHNLPLIQSNLYIEMKQKILSAMNHPLYLFELEKWLVTLENIKVLNKYLNNFENQELEYTEILDFFSLILLISTNNHKEKIKFSKIIFSFKKDLNLNLSGTYNYLLSKLFTQIYLILF